MKAPHTPAKKISETPKAQWHVVFVASSTPEKLRDMQLIAQEKRLPIIFADFREISGNFHQVDETAGNFKGNAKLKSEGVKDLIARLHIDTEDNKRNSTIGRWCEDNGHEFNPNRIHVLTEDSGFSMPKALWDAVDKTGIPKETLDRINGDGPGVETGPVLSALLGAGTLYRRLRIAADELGIDINDPNAATARDFSTAVLTNLGRGGTHTFQNSVTNYLMLNQQELDQSQTLGDSATRQVNYRFVRPKSRLGESANQLGAEYITKYGPRAELVNEVAAAIGAKKLPSQAPLPERRWSRNFNVAVLHDYDGMKRLNFYDLSERSTGYDMAKETAPDVRETQFASALKRPILAYSEPPAKQAETILRHIEDMLVASDAVILPPHTEADDDLTKFQAIYDLMSITVAKQLNPRDSNKPVILLNHRKDGVGYWDDAIKIHYDLANQFFTKEHAILLPSSVHDDNEHVTAHSNGYFHVVTGDNMAKLNKAAIAILEKERHGFVPHRHTPEHTEIHGKPADRDERFKVAIFCSASNENTVLNHNVRTLSHDLAAKNFGIVYGGGDKYTMGAVLDGVRDYRRELVKGGKSKKDAKAATYIAGISTENIAVSETKNARLSTDLNYSELTKDIYERMAKMLAASDVLVVAPGGAGTVQEWMAAMILRKTVPAFADKPIIVYNPKLLDDSEKKVWDTTLNTILGKDYNELSKEERKQRRKELGITLKDNIDDVKARIEEHRLRKHNQRGSMER